MTTKLSIADALTDSRFGELVNILIANSMTAGNKGRSINMGDSLYMERGYVLPESPETKGFEMRVHRTVRSDRDRHLHDHPWWNVSILLSGGYEEVLPVAADRPTEWDNHGVERTYSEIRRPGDIIFREANDRHRLIIAPGCEAVSLFIMGPKTQSWGFYTPAGKVDFRDYLDRAE